MHFVVSLIFIFLTACASVQRSAPIPICLDRTADMDQIARSMPHWNHGLLQMKKIEDGSATCASGFAPFSITTEYDVSKTGADEIQAALEQLRAKLLHPSPGDGNHWIAVGSADTAPLKSRAATSGALRAASYDGSWTGKVNCLQDARVSPPDVCEIGLNLDIAGESIRVQHVVDGEDGSDKKFDIKPGGFRLFQFVPNAVAFATDMGNDEDGTWVETWSFAMTLRDPEHMLIYWTRIVNNVDLPLETKGSKFSHAGTGELIRVTPKN